MIERMQKITFITKLGDMATALENVAAAELFHVPLHTAARGSGDAIQTQIAELEQLKPILPKAEINTALSESELQQRANYAQEVLEEIQTHEAEAVQHQSNADQLEAWGNFDHTLPGHLSEHGVSVQFYMVLKKQLVQFKDTRHWIIKRDKQCYVCVLVKEGETLPEDLRSLQLPETSLSDARIAAKTHKEQAAVLRRAIAKDKYTASCVFTYIEHLKQVLYAVQAHAARYHDEALEWVSGFVPFAELSKIEKICSKHGIGLYCQEIGEEDIVPSKLKKNIIANTTQPIFDLFGTIPGYKEFDIRTVFLLFFTLFFAMIVSDAGYATIFCGIAIITLLRAIVIRKNLYANVLFFILSVAALAWGAFSGSWFGNPVFLEIPFFRRFVIPYLWVDSPNNAVQISLLCMTIGMTHLFVAHLWRALRALIRKPRLQFFGECGWMGLLVGLYYLVLSVVIDASLFPIPSFAWPMIFAGLGCIVLFGSQDGRFLFGIFRGFSSIHTTVLDAIGMFSDIISYIRLYAVGLASLAVARSFTEMAASITGNSTNWALILGGGLVLVFGHALNIAMTILSVVVHGIRLNMLEFSRHLGMEWNGIIYKPLKSSPLKG